MGQFIACGLNKSKFCFLVAILSLDLLAATKQGGAENGTKQRLLQLLVCLPADYQVATVVKKRSRD